MCQGGNWKGGKTIDRWGYILVKRKKHPYANPNGYVRQHRLVMEKHLGRYLLPTEKVHHIDGNKQNNKIKNLELLNSQSEHIKKYHKDFGIDTRFKKGMTGTWTGKKLSKEHKLKVVKYLTPFKKGHKYLPRKNK